MLKDKVAVVTGGTRGIGYATVKKFLENGAKVVLLGSRQETVEKAVTSLKSENSAWEVSGAWPNLKDAKSVENEINSIKEKYGKIDILVNNAGIVRDMLMVKMTEADFDAVINVNLKGTYNMMKATYKHFMKQRSGRIISLASVVGIMGNAGQANYSASKAGIIGLTKSVAKELGGRNVTVNAIAPGYIATDMTDQLSDKAKDMISSGIPMKRAGSPEDVANAICFLASDDASYITGEVLRVDGGMAM